MKTNTFHAKKVLALLFAALLPLVASAQTKVESDGSWYNLVSKVKQAEVTFKGDSYDSYNDEYSGSITIPATVTHNGVEYSVTSIGDYAFFACWSLTSITLPEGVTSIGGYAFFDCRSLTAITIPEGVTSIGDYAFSSCSRLTAINIPEGVTSIGNYVFYGCSRLAYIDLPRSVTSIGEWAFAYCYSLTAITLPEGVTSIGNFAFEGCSRLTAINIPESVTSIGEGAFSGCTGELVVNCNIPSASSIIYGAFCGSKFTKVTIGEGVTSIGDWAFCGCSSLKSITIPESVTSIGRSVFSDCSSLTAITLPEGVTSIGDYAFSGCRSLTAINIPKGVTSIGYCAFNDCSSLTAITCHAVTPPTIASYTFKGVDKGIPVYVPAGSVEAYKEAKYWSEFTNYVGIESGAPDYLTIRQADNGEVGIAVDLGRTYKVRITPSTGWKIHTVTFDGKDMTAQLAADNTFTTPTINGSAVLNVAYVKEGSAIAAATASRIKVQGHQGTISITGATEGAAIGLYTTSGTLVATATAEGKSTQLTVPTGQVYIVKVADTVVKIGM